MRALTVLVWLTAFIACMFLSGCSQPEDIVKVDVPKEVRDETGAPAKVPLSQFKEVREDYEAKVKERADKAADEAAKISKALTKITKNIERDVADQIAQLQREASARLESVEDDAAADHARIAAAQRDLQAQFERTAIKLAKRQDDAQAKADQLRSLMNFGLQEVLPAVASQVPGVGLAIPAITLLTGLFMRKPGDSQKFAELQARHAEQIKQVADSSYDEGRRVATDQIVRASLLKLAPASVVADTAANKAA